MSGTRLPILPTVTADALGLGLQFVRAASGADRCSLVVKRSDGGSDLYGLDEAGAERRRLSIVPAQLFEHFDAHAAAELHRDLAASSFESDRSLARKGFAEVIRAPLRDAHGRTIGILNVIRRVACATEEERAFVETFAGALGAYLAAGERAGGA